MGLNGKPHRRRARRGARVRLRNLDRRASCGHAQLLKIVLIDVVVPPIGIGGLAVPLAAGVEFQPMLGAYVIRSICPIWRDRRAR